jgi:hypothetical protein
MAMQVQFAPTDSRDEAVLRVRIRQLRSELKKQKPLNSNLLRGFLIKA